MNYKALLFHRVSVDDNEVVIVAIFSIKKLQKTKAKIL